VWAVFELYFFDLDGVLVDYNGRIMTHGTLFFFFLPMFRYANLAVRHDRYNAKALVNKGNCLFANGELEKAKELYLESIGVEADCVEAIYNLGIVSKKLGVLGEALQAFEKLHTIVPSSPEGIYQIANLHDLTGNYEMACKYFRYGAIGLWRND
jgi:tetratricopeptide (TPR) repeat protein